MKTKIAFLCDLHLPYLQGTAQYAAFDWAVDTLRKAAPDFVVTLGDVTATGEPPAMEYFSEKMKSIPCPQILISGNSDVRTKETRGAILSHMKSECIRVGGTTLAALCVHDKVITEEDRQLLRSLEGPIILCIHFHPEILEEESRAFLEEFTKGRDVRIIHAHRHVDIKNTFGEAPVIGLRCLDPDKTKGLPPCIYFMTISPDGQIEIEDAPFAFPHDNLADFKSYIGFSCFSPKTDIPYAAENGIPCIEVRKFGGDAGSFSEIKALCEEFRQKGGRHISVHLPTVGYLDGAVTGEADYLEAIAFAADIKADSLTLHAPRVRRGEMKKGNGPWEAVMETVLRGIALLPKETAIGIENVHLGTGQADDDARYYGCAPEECLSFMEDVRTRSGRENIGMTLDTGHVRSNGSIQSYFTSGMWYKMVGHETVQYHIHQRGPKSDGRVSNHVAISNWYGGEISYASFFWAWQTGQINHRPMFLEVKNLENCIESLRALEALPFIK